MTQTLRITVAQFTFTARLEQALAPKTCAAFLALLPFEQQIIQARWSGESCWIPLGDFRLDVPLENTTCYPGRGEILFYPGGVSETEILFPYGHTSFASKAGQLVGSHFLTVVEGGEQLMEMGMLCLWHGAQPIRFEALD